MTFVFFWVTLVIGVIHAVRGLPLTDLWPFAVVVVGAFMVDVSVSMHTLARSASGEKEKDGKNRRHDQRP